MRSGRKIREGCQPMKWVKQRASTVNRRREIEMTLEREREERERAGQPSSGVGEEEVLQGLYAESQTELYVPEPIVDVRSVLYQCARVLIPRCLAGQDTQERLRKHRSLCALNAAKGCYPCAM